MEPELSWTSNIASPVDWHQIASHETGFAAGKKCYGVGNFLHFAVSTIHHIQLIQFKAQKRQNRSSGESQARNPGTAHVDFHQKLKKRKLFHKSPRAGFGKKLKSHSAKKYSKRGSFRLEKLLFRNRKHQKRPSRSYFILFEEKRRLKMTFENDFTSSDSFRTQKRYLIA